MKGEPANLLADARECPATWTLAASWVVVFAALHFVQWRDGVPMPDGGFANPLAVSAQVGHRFGDLTWADVRHGEAWRLVTATFIHFSIVHVGMNAFGMVKLGQLMEPWYGSGPFLALCLAIGGLGNLVGGLIRQAIALGRSALAGTRVAQAWPAWFEVDAVDGVNRSFLIHSGGGSTILLGLLGLGAVVGWRSKTRIGSFLRDQMVALLGFTAVLGFLLMNLIDNYGHAGGAIVGAGFGFIHRPLLHLSERSRWFRRACWAGSLALAATCIAAAVGDAGLKADLRGQYFRATARQQGDVTALHQLERVSILYARALSLAVEVDDRFPELDLIALDPVFRTLALAPRPQTAEPLSDEQWLARTRGELRAALSALDSRWAGTWGEDVAADIAAVKNLARHAVLQAPDYRQAFAFAVAWRDAARRVAADRDQLTAERARIERQF